MQVNVPNSIVWLSVTNRFVLLDRWCILTLLIPQSSIACLETDHENRNYLSLQKCFWGSIFNMKKRTFKLATIPRRMQRLQCKTLAMFQISHIRLYEILLMMKFTICLKETRKIKAREWLQFWRRLAKWNYPETHEQWRAFG